MRRKVESWPLTFEREYKTRNRTIRVVLQHSAWIKGLGARLVFIGQKNIALECHVRIGAWILQIHNHVRFGGVKQKPGPRTLKPLYRRHNRERWG